MASITPSDIIGFIDGRFPEAANLQASGDLPELDFNECSFISGLLRLLDKLDPALLPAGRDLVALESARAAMASTVGTWISRGGSVTLDKLKGYSKNPILILREVLGRCPDLAIPEKTAGLEFIEDPELRDGLRLDLSILEQLMYAEHWKPAMVMGGSISEALLLDALLKSDALSLRSAVQQEKNLPADPREWHLPPMGRVAQRLGIISDYCLKLVLMAQDHRNLIHPGKEIRTQQKVSRSTALVSQAALHRVIEELPLWHGQQLGR